MTGHSKLGASKAHRWFECPGSVALCATVVAPPASVHAARGTMAHDVAAKCLDRGEDAELWAGNRFEIDEHTMHFEQDDAAAVQIYLDTIRADAVADQNDAPVRMVEQKFHLKDLHRDLYGTADCVQWFKRTKLLRVYDYKHGAGVAVDVHDNPQLLYYALGALLETKAPVKEVEIVVVQPRCPHSDGPVRRQRIPAIELLEFRADLLDAVVRTEDENAPRKPGDYCRWCEAAAICPDVKRLAQETAKREFTPRASYNPQDLSETLTLLPLIEGWVEAVRQFAYGEAEHGRCPPGYKLVEKRPTRKWKDEHSAEIELQKLGLGESELYPERSLNSPAQIEKVIGKAKAKQPIRDKIAELCEAKSSGLTLVPVADKREPVKRSAQEDFTRA